jgi:hypothetical protein
MQMWRDVHGRQPSFMVVAAAAAWLQVYEYIFPLGHGWVYDYGAALETIPIHIAPVNQHAIGASLAPFVAAESIGCPFLAVPTHPSF